jgi:hypothetical protein
MRSSIDVVTHSGSLVMSAPSGCEFYTNAVYLALLGHDANTDALAQRLKVKPKRRRIEWLNLLTITPSQEALVSCTAHHLLTRSSRHTLQHVPRHQ